ncbi:hypothetical protein Q5W_15450 [Hydrogenophaga sp. PBC]|uniref:virion core protein, T7 gp14 family n=1 Tax=Hydrogenophaga sp. PBC TaxID=795665 RepID=UPI0002606A4D|nr:hypothetical protein [Hydrogenophaga sp. PBC]AOS80265.1 hypothetical protein Q5W_15450 [Hydrogenophaga sp. PBC]
MCEPTTLAIAGLAISGYGAYQGAQSQKAQATYNAQVADNNAKTSEYAAQDAIRRGDEEAAAIRRNADMLKGSQRASMAARGLDLAEGTAAELQDQTDFFSFADQATARNNAQREAWAIRNQGANYRSEAGMQRATARGINPTLAAGTSLLGGAGQVADRWYKNR